MAESEDKYRGTAELIAAGYTMESLADFKEAKDMAELKDCSADQIRTAGRSGALVAYKLFGKILFDPDDETNAAWEVGEGGGGGRSRREDGRVRYTVYFAEEELEAYKTEFMVAHEMPEDALVDPRKRSAKRRVAKAKAEAEDPGLDTDTDDGQDPFATFGA